MLFFRVIPLPSPSSPVRLPVALLILWLALATTVTKSYAGQWQFMLGHFEPGLSENQPESFRIRCAGSLIAPSVLLTSYLCQYRLESWSQTDQYPVLAVAVPHLLTARTSGDIKDSGIKVDLARSSDSYKIISALRLTTPVFLDFYPEISLSLPPIIRPWAFAASKIGYQFQGIVSQTPGSQPVNGYHFSQRRFSIEHRALNPCTEYPLLDAYASTGSGCFNPEHVRFFLSDVGAPLYRVDNLKVYLSGLIYNVLSKDIRPEIPLVTFNAHLGFIQEQLYLDRIENWQYWQNRASPIPASCGYSYWLAAYLHSTGR